MLRREGTNGKLVAHARSPTSPTTRSNDTLNGSGGGERHSSEAAIDPLSQVRTDRALREAQHGADHASWLQHILKRTTTSPAIQKLRAQNADPHAAHTQTSLHEAAPDKKQSGESPRDLSANAKADKK